MICSKCGKENAEGMQFCGFCGNNLQGKVQCTRCGTWVEQTYQYCPFCAKKLGKDQPVEPEIQVAAPVRQRVNGRVDRNKLVAIILNSLVILFSTLMVAFMFGKLAVLEPEDFGGELSGELPVNLSFKVDLIDYVETTIKSLSNYSMQDFIREGEALGADDAETPEEILEVMAKLNLLKVFVINELDKAFILERIFIFVNLIIVIAMMVLPLVALGFSIYDLVKFNKRNLGKKLFVFSFLSGLILVITTNLMLGFKPTAAVIFYLVFAALGLVSYYVLENVARERKFAGKVFATRLVTSLALVLLFILSTANVATFDFSMGGNTQSYSLDLNFRNFVGSLDSLENIEGLQGIQVNFLSLIAGQPVDSIKQWVSYVDFGFGILMLIVIGLLIASIIVETFRNTNLKPKKPTPTLLLNWMTFGFEILALITIIVIIIIYNSYFNEVHLDTFSFKIGAGIIVLMVFTLATAIYQTVTYRIQNRTVYDI